MSHYILPKLPFAYDALEPYMDAETVRVHYEGHHKAYVEKLNETLAPYPEFRKKVETLLAELRNLPPEIRTAVQNNAGGHANHTLFWTLLSPQGDRHPVGEVELILNRAFGSFSRFQHKFTEKALSHFSNGWVWLCTDRSSTLSVFTTKDHESPLQMGLTPLLVLDLWEHAYYLKHKNQRAKYIDGFWNLVNWNEVALRFEEFQTAGKTNREWRIAA